MKGGKNMEEVYCMENLLERLHTKDTYALRDAMRIYGDRLLKVAYVYLKDAEMAKDVVQTVFIKLYYKIDQFKDQSSLYTWLYRITVNECKTKLRSWSFRKIFFTDNLPEVKIQADIAEKVVRDETRDEIYNLILKMDVKYRMVILFFYYYDYSIKEIAEIMGMKEATVKTRLHRGKKILKDHLTKRGGEF